MIIFEFQLNQRIPPQFRKENRNYGESSNFEGEESRRKIKVKKGLAIEPDSGLDNIAHVYQEDNSRYTAVLSRTDIGRNQNTYYKIQLLEGDNEARLVNIVLNFYLIYYVKI